MDTWIVLTLVALALGIGAALGFLAATVRSVRREGDAAARVSAAEARAELLTTSLADLREQQEETDDVLLALAPVRTSLDRFGAQVAALERERASQYGSIRQQLEQSASGAAELREATAGLTSALRSTSARGTWGEVQLRRVLEAAGMVRHVDFSEQVTLGDGARPDALVRLPGGRSIPIDAKVPLDAHLAAEAIAPSDGAAVKQIAAHRKEHAKALRAHIDALVKRNYHGTSGADVTVMFLPAESLLPAALEADPALLEYAMRRGVVPATPTSLLALLRAVAGVWVREELSEQAEELLTIGRTLYERLGVVAGHVTALGGSITSTVAAYNKAVASIESRLLVTARQFEPLEAPALTEIPGEKGQVKLFTASELAG
ncbi:MAG: DNA recombination protein RmuC [bacterium]|nr:DNA recombination protein RmuC [bacterium]